MSPATFRRERSPEPGSPEWIALRRSGLGATDAAIITGYSRFAAPHDKYAEMKGTRAPIMETEAMLWGKLLERPVGQEWARRTGRKVRHVGYTYWLEPSVFSHYDFDVVPPKGEPVTEILEVKTSSAYGQREWGEQDTDQMPAGYVLQAHHEIMCRPGIVRCYVAVLIGGQKLQKYVVERDDELIESLLARERKFLADTAAGIPPEMDGSEAASAYLRAQFPGDDGSVIELDAPTLDVAREYLAAKAAEKEAQGQIALLGNVLKDRLRAVAVATSPEIKIVYRNNKPSKVTDWAGLAAHLMGTPDPVIVAKHTTEKPGARPLLVNWVGE